MKFGLLGLIVTCISASAIAAQEVSPKLVNLDVVRVESKGSVLKEKHNRPFTIFLISIPVEVSTGSVCTEFVGQEDMKSSSPKARLALQAKGTVDPMTDACIEIAPMPVKTEFTYNFSVLTGGFVPAYRFQEQVVRIHGAGDYLIRLDMQKNTVSIHPVR